MSISRYQPSAGSMSDSGTISEESSIVGFHAVTLRDSIERPDALDTGVIMMTGLSPDNVVETVALAMQETPDPLRLPRDCDVPNSSQRAVRFILSTHRPHTHRSGLRTRSAAE